MKLPGHVAEVPVHISAGSQAPPDARHSTDEVAKPSTGQVLLAPVQCSATSHTSTPARQTVELSLNPASGQVVSVPLHVSWFSHAPGTEPQVRPPSATWQTPKNPGALHTSQSVPLPQFAAPQQTLSTQLVLVHSEPLTHASPSVL